jgi:hypothetical protein
MRTSLLLGLCHFSNPLDGVLSAPVRSYKSQPAPIFLEGTRAASPSSTTMRDAARVAWGDHIRNAEQQTEFIANTRSMAKANRNQGRAHVLVQLC